MISDFENQASARLWAKNAPIPVKILLLFALGLFVFFFTRIDIMAITFLLLLLAYPLVGFSLKRPLLNLAKLWWLLLGLFLVQWITIRWTDSLAITLRLAILILAANLINATTKASDMLDAFERFFTLFKPLGVNPKKIALALSLTLRFVPVLKTIADEIYEAQKARGLERSFLALFIPMLIRILKMGDDVSQAILARNYDNE
ncbi:energy-coupling factor transporter transmembrane protein EcfT [Bartonella sp. HY329]|uniref:energy-coupling factor transporter transmembrane component T family protein n=1 Tax=unclassified Bartonella TaxID=2645622 RepID=UPI0021C8CAC7|nr:MULTISPECIES: energy-coupling factor transporter transmembrane component T [unclassified Bartonella]UXM95192.1 energy-coupling factor transporter transmembrane protein EcfT [Bartonella sp. HY329]UXN09515.1 energy-coupling factor transporter transmembrane protein EcfT [Bartonella sp. HY328]